MLESLGELLDICFEERTLGDDHGVDAWFFPEADRESLCRIADSSCPSYATIRGDQLVPCGESSNIEFSRHYALPPALAGRLIRADEAVKVMGLPHQFHNIPVVASKAGSPVWAIRESNGFYHHYVSLQIPELIEGEPLFQQFNGGQFLQLLPFLLFLRTLTEDQRWEQPPLQACFMIDDPNLHWRTYGFVDFAKIAAHARMHNYHVSFATVPLDTWFVHKPTALLFQKYRDQLSLLIHGNDHIAQELARPYSDEKLNRSLQQALRRIAEFERRSGVEVCRVMAPPHGACNERTLAEMASLGFEAACISRGSLHHHNGQATWLRTLGMNPSDIIGGLPVFPRFPLLGKCQNSILLAALLHQPIVAMGHHHDVAQGLQVLADISGFVNTLGRVHWTNMMQIARSHYAQRLNERIRLVRMFTRRIEIVVPEDTSQILVERPWLKGEKSKPLLWRLLSEGSEWKYQHPDEPIPVVPCQKIEIADELPISSFIDAKNFGNFHIWPVVRRQLTEARDRLAPFVKGFQFSQSNRVLQKK